MVSSKLKAENQQLWEKIFAMEKRLKISNFFIRFNHFGV